MTVPDAETLRAECRDPALLARSVADLQRLGRRVSKAVKAGEFGPPVRITVLSSFLADFVVEMMPALLLRRGIVAKLTLAPYGSIATEVLGTGERLTDSDMVIILPTHRDVAFPQRFDCSRAEADVAIASQAAHWESLWRRLPGHIVQLTFDPPPSRALGEPDGFVPGGRLNFIRRLNQALADAAPSRLAFVDAEHLAQRVGQAWHDPRIYQLCKQPFGMAAAVEVAESLAAAASGLLGKARKVLVLDLDNTVWGGVIGDVGMDGIVLGAETAEGEAFVALQSYAKACAARGIILAVCSKNQEEIAREPFASHPAMVLRESDIACFVANFEDKALNLRRIAERLNVGLDSLVFVDDNPVERAWVAREVPEVMVIDLPDNPADYCAAIEAAKPFPMHALTTEDLTRNASYRARASVGDMQAQATDMDAFLRELEAAVIVEPVAPASLDRIVQLVAKTNQFKLNPTLFTPDEIKANPDGTLALRFKDRLQDYGITAIAVTEPGPDGLIIKNWVMSCRVFSRRLEHATFELIRARAASLGLTRICLNYVPTTKNAILPPILEGLGFHNSGGNRYMAPVTPAVEPPSHFIAITRS